MSHYTHSRFRWSGQFRRRWRLSRFQQQQLRPRFLYPDHMFPRFVQRCTLTRRMISWLRLLDWQQIPATPSHPRLHQIIIPRSAYIAAYLVRLDQNIATMGQLRRFLADHPALPWALGFPLYPAQTPYGFDPASSLPSRRQFSRILSTLNNEILQRLMDVQVKQLQALLPIAFGHTISLDTKHIIAWVKENNGKAYIKDGRFHKTQQPAGDPDCKLGCKRRRNVKTPHKEGLPVTAKKSIGEFYWGYGSGAVVTKVKPFGEFVLAELTQTFDKGDTTYFFPLMTQVERRLGFRPTFGTMDAAFDAFYVYDYFHNPATGGAAIVPLNQPNGKKKQFDERGWPLCEAGLAMPVRKTYTDRTKAIIPHERAFHACPLLFPEPNGDACPVNHKRWPKGGCSVQLSTSIGARIRHQLDRESDLYTHVYKQRTAVERIFAQARALGIERPKLRNQHAITNLNTLIYLLINVRALKRVLDFKKQAR